MEQEARHRTTTAPMARSDTSRWQLLLLLAILFLAHGWFTIGRNLTMLNVNHPDALGHLPWMHRWSDPSLFPNDVMIDYFQQYHLPIGMRAVYFLLIRCFGLDLNIACRVMTALWYSLAFGLYVAVVRLAAPGRPAMICIATVATMLIPFHYTPLVYQSLFAGLEGGLARSAGPAILLATIYGIANPSWWMTSLAIVSSAACYPPAFVIAIVAAWLAALASGRDAIRQCGLLLPATLIAAGIIWFCYPLGVDPRFGPLVSLDDAAWAPEVARLHFPFGSKFGGLVWSWCAYCWPAVAAMALQASLDRSSRLLRANMIMLATSIATTLAAYWLWPRMYEINRYEIWPRSTIVFVAIAAVIAKAADRISLRWPGWSHTRLAWMAVAGFIAFDSTLSMARYLRALPNQANWSSTGHYGRRVIDLLATSPKNTKTAALGDELDSLPTYAQRSLLLSSSALWPYHRDFHREMIRRYDAIQEATYATASAPLILLRDEFGVRYLSVHRARFDPAKFESLAGNLIVKSWLPEHLKHILKMGPSHDFYLKQAPQAAIVIEDGDYQLIDLERLP